MSASQSHSNKKVKFSASSKQYLYLKDPYYDKSNRAMTFKESERKSSAKNARNEALRIKALLLSKRSKITKGSLDEHLESCGIRKEEIVGIEQQILEHPTRVMKRRKYHRLIILIEQAIQKNKGVHDIGRLARQSMVLAKSHAYDAKWRADLLK
mmetsp:Transcript_33273/g.69958  ORF Transcript_33273/g.69958 Transcript_33273/m.69958 type:complete len:154 (+) Transcript_33273:267-728(+)|eukprot:CAMPEP_0183733464 /NCGR_PEP_ID=MMETSP0737-20130205/41288_1 /TAXON_ID=385413 /ORGANISM="Thalassiosira miniscula, Strain CCMP1093" /LENGTH=153 /DNA_ID=CAMNT_0025966727 /DNA_START=164 /DNA_END=625 /DNA_ORIENTATION=+